MGPRRLEPPINSPSSVWTTRRPRAATSSAGAGKDGADQRGAAGIEILAPAPDWLTAKAAKIAKVGRFSPLAALAALAVKAFSA
jgi:hypothetical protein